jgi:hypothetical protein
VGNLLEAVHMNEAEAAVAVDVIIRVAKQQCADPASDDLTVPLAIENVALAAENARLRSALKEISEMYPRVCKTVAGPNLWDMARAALADQPVNTGGIIP